MEVRLTKKDGHFIASDHIAADELRAIAEGEHFTADIKRARNLGHHMKFFAMLGIVYEAQDKYPTSKHLLNAVKIGIGHADLVNLDKNVAYYDPRSINFAQMDQSAFEQFYDKAIMWIVSKKGPLNGADKEEIVQQVMEFLGDRY